MVTTMLRVGCLSCDEGETTARSCATDVFLGEEAVPEDGQITGFAI